MDRNQITLCAFGRVFTHGTGSLYNAGSGGITPSLTGLGCPSPGETVTLNLDAALGGRVSSVVETLARVDQFDCIAGSRVLHRLLPRSSWTEYAQPPAPPGGVHAAAAR